MACCYCERKFTKEIKKTKEHIVPVSRGGADTPKNLATCCSNCNSWRSNKELRHWRDEVEALIVFGRTRSPYSKEELKAILTNIPVIQQSIGTTNYSNPIFSPFYYTTSMKQR